MPYKTFRTPDNIPDSMFERFLDPDRASMPDIDQNFDREAWNISFTAFLNRLFAAHASETTGEHARPLGQCKSLHRDNFFSSRCVPMPMNRFLH